MYSVKLKFFSNFPTLKLFFKVVKSIEPIDPFDGHLVCYNMDSIFRTQYWVPVVRVVMYVALYLSYNSHGGKVIMYKLCTWKCTSENMTLHLGEWFIVAHFSLLYSELAKWFRTVLMLKDYTVVNMKIITWIWDVYVIFLIDRTTKYRMNTFI